MKPETVFAIIGLILFVVGLITTTGTITLIACAFFAVALFENAISDSMKDRTGRR